MSLKRCLSVVAMVFFYATPLVFAQSNNTGRTLDNNLLRGGNGTNPLRQSRQQSLGNAIVTGNVSGGRQFQGKIKYRGIGDFHGRARSDSLFRFQANSTKSNIGRKIDGRIRSRQVYRSSTANASRDVTRATSASDLLIGKKRAQANISGLQYQAVMRGFEANRTSTIGKNLDTMLEQSGLSIANGRRKTYASSQLTRAKSWRRKTSNAADDVLLSDYQVKAENHQPFTSDKLKFDHVKTAQVDFQIKPQHAGNQMQTLDQRIAALEAKVLGPEGSIQVAPSEDVTMMLRARQEQRALIVDNKPVDLQLGYDPNNTLLKPADNTANLVAPQAIKPVDAVADLLNPQSADSVVDKPAVLPSLEVFRQKALADQAAAKQGNGLTRQEVQQMELESRRRARGLSEVNPLTDELAVIEQLQADRKAKRNRVNETNREIKIRRQRRAVELLDGPSDLPADQSNLSAQQRLENKSKPVNLMHDLKRQKISNEKFELTLMKAQNELHTQKYALAEQHFKQLLTEKPDHLEANVGFVHALLALGSVRQGAFHLQRLLTNHPQIIGRKYSAENLPAKTRLVSLNREMSKILKMKSLNYAGLVLAYLGYQTGKPQAVKQGLASLKKSNAYPKLLKHLEASWLK